MKIEAQKRPVILPSSPCESFRTAVTIGAAEYLIRFRGDSGLKATAIRLRLKAPTMSGSGLVFGRRYDVAARPARSDGSHDALHGFEYVLMPRARVNLSRCPR